MNITPHNFYIPVMGIAFTIDSPIKVARFGITSALSIIEDNIIEVMRKHYYEQIGEEYTPISTKEEDYRARRITDYLNLVNKIVQDQVNNLKNSAFEAGSDLVKYFEMLPEKNSLKEKFNKLKNQKDPLAVKQLKNLLRKEIKPGAIEVNIMTKVDKDNYHKNGAIKENASDALEALKAYAKSDLENSAVIFSAGMNPRLYNYLENFKQFEAKSWGVFNKRVIIKVSDYRSALIQGKYLAKKAIWVSEFRIESGLNCGGHAFATQGFLLGPILEEFKLKRNELVASISEIYNQALKAKNKKVYEKPHPIRITVQGGIGTNAEAEFLQNYYQLDGTGWGTPFLLCPEATTVEEETLKLLSKAEAKDVVLSKNSPLGVRFNYLKGTSAEKEKEERIKRGIPGSPCTEKYLVSNTEFTKEPICTASRKYQKLKLKQLQEANLPEEEYNIALDDLLAKECLCIGLSNAAAVSHNQAFLKNLKAVTICPGPNISNFSKIVGLKEMTDHIYGRSNLIENTNRPHMFVRELELYIDYFKEQISEIKNSDKRAIKNLIRFQENLLKGISYYKNLFASHTPSKNASEALIKAENKLKELALV